MLRIHKRAAELFVLFISTILVACESPPEGFQQTGTPLIWTQDSQSEIFLARQYLDVFEDTSADKTLDDIISNPAWFQPTSGSVPAYQFTKSAIWTRLHIHHVSKKPSKVLLNMEYSFFDHIDVYQLDAQSNIVATFKVGDAFPFEERPVIDHSFVIPLQLEPNSDYTIVTRRDSKEAMFLMESLWSPEEFHIQDRMEQLFIGLFYGAMLVMLIYNLLLYASTLELTYLLYCIYLALHALFLFAYRGFAFAYLWPSSPEIHSISLEVLAPAAQAALAIFTQSYLNTKEDNPKHHRILRYIFIMYVVLSVVCPFLPGALAMVVITLVPPVTCMYLLWLAVSMWSQGHLAARYFVLAFFVNFAAYIITSAFILTSPDLNLDSALGYMLLVAIEVGVLLELVLLSIGVGYRMMLLRKEATMLQERNLQFQASAREALEQEVKNQTQELRSTLNTLENTQRELVQQARLATVGNLVTGLAHEIGNPLNLTIGGAQELEDIVEESKNVTQESLPQFMKQIQSCAGLITRGSERIETIVRNLNQLAQTGEKPNQASCNLEATVRATIELLRHRIEQEGIVFDLNFSATPRVLANSGELSQVLLNLFLNACDAMSAGGQISIETKEVDSRVLIDIVDSGSGVPESARDHVFDAFYTTKENGTGLGLAISHQMVTSWDGHLSLEASEVGAHFRMSLQIAES